MKIHIISHESCPCEVCTVHIYVLGNLIVGLCYFLLSPVFLFHTAALEATHTHTHTLKEAETYIYTFTHSYTLSHTKCMENRLSSCQTAACFLFFFPCSFLNRTCLKFQALTQSVPGRLICNAAHRRGYLFWGSHMHVHERTEMHTQAAACACVSTGAAKRRNPCKPAD